MTEQAEPREAITIEQYQQALRTGKGINPSTLVLMPVELLQAIAQLLDEAKEDLIRVDQLAEQRKQVIAQALVLLGHRS